MKKNDFTKKFPRIINVDRVNSNHKRKQKTYKRRKFLRSNMSSRSPVHPVAYVKETKESNSADYLVVNKCQKTGETVSRKFISKNIDSFDGYDETPIIKTKDLDPFTSDPNVLEIMKIQSSKLLNNKQR